MSPFSLNIFTLIIFATYGSEITPNISCGSGNLLVDIENDSEIKIVSSNDSAATFFDDRTVKRPILTSTTSPVIFKPTPTDSNQPSETTIAALGEIGSAIIPNTVALPPPATTIEPQEPVTICGKMANCYRWFDDVWALELSGYKRCELRDERRAKRYCCIPPPPKPTL